MKKRLDRLTHAGPWLAKLPGYPDIVLHRQHQDHWAAAEEALLAYEVEGVAPSMLGRMRLRPITEAQAADLHAVSRPARVMPLYRRLAEQAAA